MMGAEHKIDFTFSKWLLSTIFRFLDSSSFASEVNKGGGNMSKISYEMAKELKESHDVSKFCDRCSSRPAFDNWFAVVPNANSCCTNL